MKHGFAKGAVFGALLQTDIAPNVGACFTGDNEAFPCGRWVLGFGGDDVDLVAVIEFAV